MRRTNKLYCTNLGLSRIHAALSRKMRMRQKKVIGQILLNIEYPTFKYDEKKYSKIALQGKSNLTEKRAEHNFESCDFQMQIPRWGLY